MTGFQMELPLETMTITQMPQTELQLVTLAVTVVKALLTPKRVQKNDVVPLLIADDVPLLFAVTLITTGQILILKLVR